MSDIPLKTFCSRVVFPWVLFLVLALPLSAQVRGSVETLENEANALSWTVYDFGDGFEYEPGWDLFEMGDADAYTIVAPDSGVSIFASADSSGGDFVGDYSGERIIGIGCEAWVEDASRLDFAEFYFVSGGTFYYSIEFTGSGSFVSGVWDYLSVDFEADPWYILTEGGFVEIVMSEAILSSISEVGVNFFTNETGSGNMLVAIDDFYSIPETIVPELTIGTNGDDFELSFMREVSQEYDVLVSTTLDAWSGLVGQQEITGDSLYTVSDPIGDKRFYQVETDYFFTIVPDVDSP